MAARRRRRPGRRKQPGFVVAAITVGLAIAAVAAALAWRSSNVAAPPPPPSEPAPKIAAAAPPPPAAPVAAPPERAPSVTTAALRPDERPAAHAPKRADDGVGRVAIVLDDCGHRLDLMERAVRTATPMTFAVLPHLAHSRASAELAYSAGHEVILHQPMEAGGDEDEGPGVLRVGMPARQVARVLEDNLRSVPHAVGLNNHMGSRATADVALMTDLAGATGSLRASLGPLYLLDSRTTADTVALRVARRLGVPATERSVFLDNEPDPVRIRGQLDELLERASRDGEAVGIGHLKPETLNVLEAVLPGVPERELRFVFVSDLVR